MTSPVTTISPDAPVKEAAKRMIEHNISALPVVDGKNRVAGIVSEGDLIRRAEIGTEARRPAWLRAFMQRRAREYLKARGARVSDVMTHPVVSVRRTTPLHEVARVLEKHQIKRVPVLDGGRLAGIVSRADLVRQLATAPARPTARSARDRALRREVLKKLQPGLNFNATVEHGIVHLWGDVRSRAEQKALQVAARAIDGVRKVEDHTSVMPLGVAAALGLL